MNTKEVLFNLFVLSLFSPLLIVFAVLAFTKQACIERKQIYSVGGCDQYGHCGVTLSDGSHSRAQTPSIGQEVCTNEQTIWRWK